MVSHIQWGATFLKESKSRNVKAEIWCQRHGIDFQGTQADKHENDKPENAVNFFG